MTFDLALANTGGAPMSLSNVEPVSDNNRTPIRFDASMFSSLMCNGNDLLDSIQSFEVINTKDSAQNYITEEISSLTVKVAQPLTENNYYALVYNYPEYDDVHISYVRCTEENMSNDFVKIDDTTYNCTWARNMNEDIRDGGQVSIIFFDTINDLPEDFGDSGQFNDFELFISNINNIISTTLECQTPVFFPSSEGIYVVEGELKEGVTSIGQDAFEGCKSLTSITFADDSQLTSIGGGAFAGCYSLTSIEIPSGVTSIGKDAFEGCESLTSIEIPSGVTSIGEKAFCYCESLTSITCNAITAPSVQSRTFYAVGSNGTLYYPEGSDYSSWLSSDDYYLGFYGWNGSIINSEPK